jgi:nucleoid-associated protein YgaU
MGQPPAGEETRERRATRTTQVVEIEIGSPIKFEKKGQGKKTQAAETAVIEEGGSAGNRGYLTESVTPPALEPATSQEMEKYTVQKNDTLQKISKKFYGTTKKWTKIYEANKDTLKGPDKIYPGKVITIPKEGMIKEQPTENLK